MPDEVEFPADPEILEEEKTGFFSQFPRIYWVADALELFERGAYYGMLSILSVHMIFNLNIEPMTVGLLLSFLLFFSYFWPLLAASLAEKFGYKNVILASFAFLISLAGIGNIP